VEVGPEVVVNRAERQFSGRSEARSVEIVGVGGCVVDGVEGWSGAGSKVRSGCGAGMEIA